MNEFARKHVLPHLTWAEQDRLITDEGGDRVLEFEETTTCRSSGRTMRGRP